MQLFCCCQDGGRVVGADYFGAESEFSVFLELKLFDSELGKEVIKNSTQGHTKCYTLSTPLL